MRKRGQIFLLASLVLTTIILGLTLIYVSTRAPQEEKVVYDLSNEIKTEGIQVINYGTIQNKNEAEIKMYLEDLVKAYALNHPEKEFITIFGNKEKILVFNAKIESTGEIGLSVSSPSVNFETEVSTRRLYKAERSSLSSNNVIISLGENNIYTFNLKDDETFYVLVKKDRGDERIIIPK